MRSCVNWVAHALIEDVIDPDWTDLRNVLNVARIAVETTDIYRALYGDGNAYTVVEWSHS
jgi:hypothetical protein